MCAESRPPVWNWPPAHIACPDRRGAVGSESARPHHLRSPIALASPPRGRCWSRAGGVRHGVDRTALFAPEPGSSDSGRPYA